MNTGCGSGLGKSDISCVCRHGRAQAAAHKISEYQEREKARVAVSDHVGDSMNVHSEILGFLLVYRLFWRWPKPIKRRELCGETL